jgi:hypothetical protein
MAAAATLAPMALGHTRTSSRRPANRTAAAGAVPVPAAGVTPGVAGHAATLVTPAGVYNVLNAVGQGLTLVHFSAQRKHLL